MPTCFLASSIAVADSPVSLSSVGGLLELDLAVDEEADEQAAFVGQVFSHKPEYCLIFIYGITDMPNEYSTTLIDMKLIS